MTALARVQDHQPLTDLRARNQLRLISFIHEETSSRRWLRRFVTASRFTNRGLWRCVSREQKECRYMRISSSTAAGIFVLGLAAAGLSTNTISVAQVGILHAEDKPAKSSTTASSKSAA